MDMNAAKYDIIYDKDKEKKKDKKDDKEAKVINEK